MGYLQAENERLLKLIEQQQNLITTLNIFIQTLQAKQEVLVDDSTPNQKPFLSRHTFNSLRGRLERGLRQGNNRGSDDRSSAGSLSTTGAGPHTNTNAYSDSDT